jgi:hypothetical protein
MDSEIRGDNPNLAGGIVTGASDSVERLILLFGLLPKKPDRQPK